ncbi:hypothetical protein BDV39DRAFT_199851 [Aspergillus sergii]|uniref:Uncharacterized protein n=1 Tax=Aspergillus sergii TaxID=1034303 RepID=A0A5N6XMN7_9EURO|nr:hypothetical protein BDV39DRAFT_199851 [Aspergillus sergii]
MDSRASNLSNLSSEKYGYDFVVATTQASINSDLRLFLSEEDQPVSYTCFCMDAKGNPTIMIGLEELLILTDGVNPFEIPKGTPYEDSRVQKLFGVRFDVGIKMQVGLPPGIAPRDLLPVISLGESASNVKFTMCCSQLTVVQLKPPSGYVPNGKWNVWSQPYGDPWYVQTKWTGRTDWGSLGPATEKTASGSASNPAEGQTSGSQLLAGHFRTHASELRILGDSPPFDATDNVIDDLLTALSNEGQVLGTTYTQLQELAKDFSSMNLEDVLKRLAGILGDVVLSSARVVVDALLDVLHDMASAAVTLLDTKIHIPVISDILNAIGVPDLSFLDLFTWIAVVAYTVVYKIGKSEAPFPDSNEVQTIISATS